VNRAVRAAALDRADARLRRELDLIWADFASRRVTRREAEIAHDRALAAAGLPVGFDGGPSCDPRAD
jgi:hypothetical protein